MSLGEPCISTLSLFAYFRNSTFNTRTQCEIKEVVYIKIVDHSGAWNPKANDMEPRSPEIIFLEPWSPSLAGALEP